MTRPLPAVDLDKARQQLREHVDHMCLTQTLEVEYDDGRTAYLTAPARLALVEAETTSAGVGAFSARSRPPTRIDTLSLLAELDQATRHGDDETRADAVFRWGYDQAERNGAVVLEAAATAARWREQVNGILEPTPKFRLRGQACPACKATKVWDHHDAGAGESHRRPALEIDPDDGVARCRCCAEEWPPSMWPHLGAVLEQQQRETLAVEGWDPAVKARTDAERAPTYGDASVSWLRMPHVDDTVEDRRRGRPSA